MVICWYLDIGNCGLFLLHTQITLLAIKLAKCHYFWIVRSQRKIVFEIYYWYVLNHINIYLTHASDIFKVITNAVLWHTTPATVVIWSATLSMTFGRWLVPVRYYWSTGVITPDSDTLIKFIMVLFYSQITQGRRERVSTQTCRCDIHVWCTALGIRMGACANHTAYWLKGWQI